MYVQYLTMDWSSSLERIRLLVEVFVTPLLIRCNSSCRKGLIMEQFSTFWDTMQNNYHNAEQFSAYPTMQNNYHNEKQLPQRRTTFCVSNTEEQLPVPQCGQFFRISHNAEQLPQWKTITTAQNNFLCIQHRRTIATMRTIFRIFHNAEQLYHNAQQYSANPTLYRTITTMRSLYPIQGHWFEIFKLKFWKTSKWFLSKYGTTNGAIGEAILLKRPHWWDCPYM